MIDISGITIDLNGFTESEAEDIRNCLSTLYSIRTGEQPLDRNFGISNYFLDKPIPVAKNLFALEVIEKTKMYEKRVAVEKVEYEYADGKLYPKIYVKRGDQL